MSANDEVSLGEISDQVESGLAEPDALHRDVTPPPRGYQNLFRAVCLKTRKTVPESA